MSDKIISPYRAYSLVETADLIGMHPVALRRKLQEDNRTQDPFIQKANPQKIGKEWRFMGENILRALGSASFQDAQHVAETNNAAGAAIVKDKE